MAAEDQPFVRRLRSMEAPENCRYYEQRYPQLEDFVMVRVTNISETAAYVQLLEYNKIEGMIPLTELSRRRIRSVNKHIRVGKTEVVQVFRLDSDKGYIDLSKKKVTEDDIKPCETRFNKAKDVHSIMQHVARECNVDLESLYRVVGWPLYKKHGHAYDAFAMAFHDPEKIFGPMNLPEDIKEKFIATIRHRHKAQPFRIRADLEVTCFKYEGIDAVREALAAGEALSTPEVGITIRLLAAPKYVVVATALDKDVGLEAVDKSIAAVRGVIVSKGGKITISRPPAVVSAETDFKHHEEEDDDGDEEDEEDEEDEDEDDGDGEGEGGEGEDEEEQ
eukprot:NODE_1954_length_1345_cov_28.606481_g1771_i0.p1 GENE.NODE_1954_length_1345_cov_28.606481_g1771_i0~~NODE_1954_length_1345_cov_28.606481_g1771_i0.p1  ORF type:complete len:334 (+),score=80.94 NODE_1954_length_1345_cov_28.606481_g1771_i0:151-1152(+)